MTLPTKRDYTDRYDVLTRRLTANLENLRLPSLAGRIIQPGHEITVDYCRDRKVPLQLSLETGQVCSTPRHRFVRDWISRVDAALMPGSIEVLEGAGRPDDPDRAPLSVLHLRALAGRLWDHGPVYDLLQCLPVRVRLEVMNGIESVGFSFPPAARSRVLTSAVLQPVDSADLLDAAKLVGDLWSEFNSHAAAWLASGGISRLVISRAIEGG